MVIIGAGIAGLCAGVYARKSGFATQMFEMHSIAGGLATAWTRGGYTFENCVHWQQYQHYGSHEDQQGRGKLIPQYRSAPCAGLQADFLIEDISSALRIGDGPELAFQISSEDQINIRLGPAETDARIEARPDMKPHDFQDA
jgi:phytoene dehydrogenase-like protein